MIICRNQKGDSPATKSPFLFYNSKKGASIEIETPVFILDKDINLYIFPLMHSAFRRISVKVGFCVFLRKSKTADIGISNRAIYYFLSLIAACAAARRAMGTRKGLQET